MLGTGSAMCTRCYNTCFYLKTPRGGMLTDGGGGNGIFGQLDRAGINVADIRHIMVTHVHTDHLLGIIWLIIRRRRAAKAAYTQMAEPAQADTPADKTALTAQDVIVPPADPGEPDEPESDYDGAQAYAAYARRTSGSTQHYIGHAGQE